MRCELEESAVGTFKGPPASLKRSMSDESNQFQDKVNDYHAQGEEYVRANPTQAVLSAVAAGFVLRLLPIGALVGLLTRLAIFALRPAVFIYGAVALYKHFQGAPPANDEH